MMTVLRLLAVVVLACGPALAQPASAPSPAVAPTPAQAQQALSVLKDDARRAEMIGVLETLARAAPATAMPASPGAPAVEVAPGATAPAGQAPAGQAMAGQATATKPVAVPAETPKLAIPLAPDSLGAQLLVGVSEKLESLSDDVGGTVRTLTNFTLLERWARGLAADPESRSEVFDAGWKFGVVATIALLIETAARRLVVRPRRALLRFAPQEDPTEPASPNTPSTKPRDAAARRRERKAKLLATLRRIPLILARLLLDLIPILAMGAAGYGLLGSRLGEPTTTKLVILALLNAYVFCRVATVATRAILSPDAPALQLVPISPEMARGAVRWMRRLAVVALFGYALTEVALLFGLYRVAHDALLKLVALAVHLMLVVIVIQNRAPIAALIRAAPDATGVLAVARNRVAAIWHIVVIFYIVALWTVWALDVPGGFAKLLLVFVSTLVVGTIARLLSVLLIAWLDHTAAPEPGAKPRTPGVDNALRRYLPVLRTIVDTMIGIGAFILLMEIWGLESLAWFRSDALGGRLLSAVATSAITILVGLAIWEGANASVQNHLARLAREGQPARSARLRTLLPMMRTTLLVAISMFAGLTVLSQIGVNIAPLLAGASVIGLAIGFGSQKLVQDIITGMFLLLENTMQVGDVVTLGGLTGTVENLSVRVIRLRALDGAVHIVPFSAVTTVTNLTRDFAYAMLDVSVGLNEDCDHVSEVVQDVAETMRAEPRWGAAITDRMEIMGVERFIDTAWVLRCRIKTVPSQRWAVGRELNRRLKYRFDELAIESPFTSYRALSAAEPPPPNAKTEDVPGRAAA